MSDVREFTVSPAESGTRLDVFLARHMPDWSRNQVQRQVKSGAVAVGPRAAYKAGEILESGARVMIRAARHEIRAEPEDLPLEILYEDDDLLVVNKPADMVVHVGAGVKSGTLVNALLHHIGRQGNPGRSKSLSTAGGELRPGIVHRLDRMTSGLVVVAKNDAAHRSLSAQFKAREVHKRYLALVHGVMPHGRGEIAKPVGRDPRRRIRMRPGGIGAREASTRYRVLKRFARFTLVEAEPLTGRTHQIRVHLSSLGHPIAGDTLYGAPARFAIAGREVETLARNFLHAAAIEFRHPRTGQTMQFEAPLPAELQGWLETLESGRTASG